ncbi:ubiquinone biosynthesis protein UbiJ [Lampropedia hyalina DSM 16112]|jgi:ubiquinone biosynthesis protein UbiJ|uniref:Ubiquinone biosynthesis protein UbiJ n=1 Tax=Lampropedia hyalina DSM 16112 TaxID=1122156 RepID=A0A1M5D149_9BURK|nr:hypothetical protein [Lampropedia hyalina]SHF60728.1 ubiquinone biosynthesis protein UbiJ [Lampropedia hyalina DSM 16112]
MTSPQSPLFFLRNLFSGLEKTLTPPPWLVHEVQHRVVLLVNHVLQQEPQAQERLATQRGKAVFISWRQFHMQVKITPAGLLDLDEDHATNHLLLEITETSPSALARDAIHGQKPPIRIAGDVQLASELNWVIDNVRWDLEDDLARLIGDVPAHKVSNVARRVAQELRGFAQNATGFIDGLRGQKNPTHDAGTASDFGHAPEHTGSSDDRKPSA